MGMADLGVLAKCSNDVLIGFAESFKVFPGLLALAVVFGAFLGIVAAAVLYARFLKPQLVTRKFQGYDTRRIFEAKEEGKNDDQSDCAHAERRACQIDRKTEKMQPPSSDVAAFALKAKVVYPINQRYRPLADGASNPSLHENSKMAILHHPESLSSSSLESLSQDNNDDDSSHFVSSSPVPKSFQNEKFLRVSHFPETLCCLGFEGRISLYCLGLQGFQQLCSDLQEEWHNYFLQILSIIFHKEKADSGFYNNILLTQEKELEELKKEASVKLLTAERSEDPGFAHSTLEEMERSGRARLEHGLQMVVSFSKQLERLCQQVQGRPGDPPGENVQEMMDTLIHSLLLVERDLSQAQNSHMKSMQERLLWWEELTAWLYSRAALLRQEAACQLKLVAKTLEQLTSSGQVSFTCMERLVAELQRVLREELQQCSEECISLTKKLVQVRVKKMEVKRRRQMKAQAKEQSSTLDTVSQHRDIQDFLRVFQAVLSRQRKERSDLEEQQDWKLTEAVCDMWKRHHLYWSGRLTARVQELLQSSMPEQAVVPREQCQQVVRDLNAQTCQRESMTRKQLEGVREQLEQDRQTWDEEEALVSATLAHLTEQQLKILKEMLSRQRNEQECVAGSLTEEKHQLLLLMMQRLFMARHFSLRMLKEMRLSRLKHHAYSDVGSLELEDPGQDLQTSKAGPKDLGVGEVEKRLGPETHLVGQGFHQEFLSELDTGTEFLQEHAQLLAGHTLAQGVRQQANITPTTECLPEGNDRTKQGLVETASESVYVTRESISVLIHNYYGQMQNIISTLQRDQPYLLQDEESNIEMGRNQLLRSLQKELANWERKPTSSKVQQRVENQKKRFLCHCDLELKATYSKLRKKKSVLDCVMNSLQRQLQEAEEAFMSRLASGARVPLPCSEGSSLRPEAHLGHAAEMEHDSCEESLPQVKVTAGVSKEEALFLQNTVLPGRSLKEQGPDIYM